MVELPSEVSPTINCKSSIKKYQSNKKLLSLLSIQVVYETLPVDQKTIM